MCHHQSHTAFNFLSPWQHISDEPGCSLDPRLQVPRFMITWLCCTWSCGEADYGRKDEESKTAYLMISRHKKSKNSRQRCWVLFHYYCQCHNLDDLASFFWSLPVRAILPPDCAVTWQSIVQIQGLQKLLKLLSHDTNPWCWHHSMIYPQKLFSSKHLYCVGWSTQITCWTLCNFL